MRVLHCEDPAKRTHWWGKLARNVLRNRGAEEELRALGWEVLVVWECETRGMARLRGRLAEFVGVGEAAA